MPEAHWKLAQGIALGSSPTAVRTPQGVTDVNDAAHLTACVELLFAVHPTLRIGLIS